MARSMSDDEVRQEHIRLMGPALGAVFHALYGQMNWLSYEWSEYCVLFRGEADVLPLLNRAAGGFFRIVQDSLWNQVLLRLYRLTEYLESGAKKARLTIQRLPPLFRPGDPTKAAELAELERLVAAAVVACRFAHDRRHKRLAHSSLDEMLGRKARPTPVGTMEQVDAAFAAIAAVLNYVAAEYGDGHTMYADIVVAPTGAEALVWHLRACERRSP